MNGPSSLNEIKTTLKNLLWYAESLENEGQLVHQIDKDLLLEKIRSLYAQMRALDTSDEEKGLKNTVTENDIPDIENTTETIVEEKEIIPERQKVENQKIPVTEPEEPILEPKEKIEAGESSKTVENTDEPVVKKALHTEKPEKIKEPDEKSKTTLDLFSAAPPETLGETLKPSGDRAIADSPQINGISDLREAIGINDKFLFINELFNGDLERYNKVVDELNDFSNLLGAQTYISELQVQYQWDEESPAYQKLNNLLERKFA